MPKSKPFTIRLSEEAEAWLERERVRTKLPKGALLEALAEEAIHTRKFPGICFRGAEHSRRAWVIGTSLDVWEIVELYRGKGRERLFSEHNVSERQLDLALSYYQTYPLEIERALEENARSAQEWHALSPSVIPLLKRKAERKAEKLLTRDRAAMSRVPKAGSGPSTRGCVY